VIEHDRFPLSQQTTSNDTYRIGLLDSGVGGLSVLREVYRQLPAVAVSYIGDTANVPYGDKPIPVLRDLAIRLTSKLIDSGVSAVIMASGTSTVAGLEPARLLFPDTPIFGVIEPGAKAAVAHTDGPIGVMATTATCHSLAFTHAIQHMDANRPVFEMPCPRFVPLVESGRANSEEAVDACMEYLRPLVHDRVSAIILGCTHFPFLIESLHAALERMGTEHRPVFVDPAVDAVKDAGTALGIDMSKKTPVGRTDFFCTGNPQLFAENASLLLGTQVTDVQYLDLAIASGRQVAEHNL